MGVVAMLEIMKKEGHVSIVTASGIAAVTGYPRLSLKEAKDLVESW